MDKAIAGATKDEKIYRNIDTKFFNIIYMPGTYKQLELEYETVEEARSVFDDIRSAYESGRIDVYI